MESYKIFSAKLLFHRPRNETKKEPARSYLLALLLLITFVFPVSSPATTYYVDDDALGDPGPGDPTVSDPLEDGTAAHPFDAIQEGLNTAVSGVDDVTVRDGTYTGFGNKNLNFLGKTISVRSQNGPGVTIIDCERDGRGFHFFIGETTTSVLDGFTITNGLRAIYGAGIYCHNSSPTIMNCVISGNSSYNGGGILCRDSSPTIVDCVITGNEASNLGGGIHCRDSSSPDILNCTIAGNTADLYGGGIYCGNNISPTITNCTISGNSAGDGGGGIYCGNNSSPTITDCMISGNSADWDGGGIYCGNNSSPTITHCTISGNSAGERGGGIYCENFSSPTISHCTLSGNTSVGYGGAIACESGGDLSVTNCLIIDNTAGTRGGGLYAWYSNLAIANCTISNNTAVNEGGGVYHAAKSMTITNSILWANTPEEIFVYVFADPLKVEYSDVQGGTGEAWFGVGCIDVDPEFVAAQSDNYHLLWSSPCIDTGDNGAANLPAEDLDGYPRIQFGKTSLTVDMGAYEFGNYFTFTNIETVDGGALSPAEIELTWCSSGLAGTFYDMYYSDDSFSDAMAWFLLQSDIPTGGAITTYTDVSAPDSGHRFYRALDKGTGLYSHDTVGLMWKHVGKGRNLVSTPFIPFDTTLDAVIGGQLTGSFNKFFSDVIETWDPATLHYKRAWYDNSNWKDWDTGGAPQFGFDPDVGYWVNVPSFNPAADIAFLGKVSTTGRTMEIGLGRNLCGTCYPAEVALDDSFLIESGFTGSFNQFFSDTIEWWNAATLHYERVWYDTSSSTWQGWDAGPLRTFSPCDGFWVNILSFNTPFTWIYPKPYSEPPND